MTVQVNGNGAWAYSATNPAPTYPTNLVVYWKPSVTTPTSGPATPAGWTQIVKDIPDTSINASGGYTSQGIDTGNMGWAVYYQDVVGAPLTGSVTVTMTSSSVAAAKIFGCSRSLDSFDNTTPMFQLGNRLTTPTSPMAVVLNVTGGIGLKAGDVVLMGMAIPTDVTTPAQFSAQSITHSGTTFDTLGGEAEADTSLGQDLGGWAAYVRVSAGSDSPANPTITATLAGTLTNVRGPVWMIRVRDKLDAPPPTVTDYWGSAA
jgi:hypothetical protein